MNSPEQWYSQGMVCDHTRPYEHRPCRNCMVAILEKAVAQARAEERYERAEVVMKNKLLVIRTRTDASDPNGALFIGIIEVHPTGVACFPTKSIAEEACQEVIRLAQKGAKMEKVVVQPGERIVAKHCNDLTPGELERLALLLEEMGEAQQIIGKILRHGYKSFHPEDDSVSNRGLLEKEIGDVLAALDLLVKEEDLNDDNLSRFRYLKHKTVKPYLHHQNLEIYDGDR